jgi:hypothetical protein
VPKKKRKERWQIADTLYIPVSPQTRNKTNLGHVYNKGQQVSKQEESFVTIRDK